MASDLEECPARKKVKTTTPKAKAEAKPKSPKTPKTPKSPKSAKPPKEKTPKDKTDSAPRPNKATKIPTCMEEMTDADKMIIRMKDAGSSNAEIAKAWNDLTGANVTGDSIKTRVRRIKDNLQVWPTGHAEALLEAKTEVEANLEKHKWELITKAVEGKVGTKYGIEAAQKKFKQVEKHGIQDSETAAATVPTPAASIPAGSEEAEEAEEAHEGEMEGVKEEGDEDAEEEELGDFNDILDPEEDI